MSYAVGKDGQLFVNQYNLTPYLKGYDPEAELALEDCTVLGDAGRKSWPGLVSGGIGFDAIYDRTATSAFDVLRTALLAATPSIVTAFPEGSTAGYPADLCYALPGKMGAPVKIGSLQMVTGYYKSSDDGIDLGVSLQALAAVTGTGNGTSVDNGAATTNGGVAVLHTTAIAGAAPSVVWKVQHSSDNSTWADLSGATFTAATAISSERLEVAAGVTVNRHLRAVRTFGGTTSSIISVIAFARR